MTIKVYIWMPNDERVGHVSMELTNGTYISWWPPQGKTVKSAKKGKKKNKGKLINFEGGGSTAFDLDEDIKNEGGKPNHKIRISSKKKLDEEEMEEWWEDWSSTGHYELLSYNCAWAVYKCLREGGAPMSATIVWRPETVRRYLRLWLGGANGAQIWLNLPGTDL